ncbi:MAG: hypothetical protein EXQ52_12345 [Bryobacterales bacterium]|nr:hypothetical protein [Bryobacterales bacterium]
MASDCTSEYWQRALLERSRVYAVVPVFLQGTISIRRSAKINSEGDWRTPGDVRRTFNAADFIGGLTVFDVGQTGIA